MDDDGESVRDLGGLLEEIKSAGDDPAVISVADIQHHLGTRSFGPLILFAGVTLMTPLVNIPGLPSMMGIVIMLTAAQMLIGRSSIWLPEAIRARKIARKRVTRAADFVKPAARLVDKLIRPRLTFLTRSPMVYLVAACCTLLGMIMPPLELIPMTSAIPAVPVAVLGLALTARDGVLVLLGFLGLVLAAYAVLSIWAAVL